MEPLSFTDWWRYYGDRRPVATCRESYRGGQCFGRGKVVYLNFPQGTIISVQPHGVEPGLPKNASEHAESATAAGLQYMIDSAPGFGRKGAGKGFYYLDKKGQRITDADTIARIKRIVIPPAWTEVWICPRPDGHTQATGRDAKKRKQYRYHERYHRSGPDAHTGRAER